LAMAENDTAFSERVTDLDVVKNICRRAESVTAENP